MKLQSKGDRMTGTDWLIKGPQFGSCNCAWGCPCQFNALPTLGNCEGMMSMRIDEGHFGDIRLDGLHWVSLFHWPGAIHEGGGARQTIIDARADEAQRQGLLAIINGDHGEPGATIFQVLGTVIDTVHDPLFLPIEFECNVKKRTGRLSVPGIVESTGEPIRNPVTGEEHRAIVTLPHGFEYTVAEFGSGSTRTSGKIELDHKDSYGQFAMIHMTGAGPNRDELKSALVL